MEIALQFWKSDTALKTIHYEGVKIKFGPQFFFSTLAMYVAYVFCKKNDQNRTNMSVVAAQTKHCHAEGVPTLYPVLASFQQSEGCSNVLAPISLGLSFRTDFFGTLEPPLRKDVP